MINGYTPHAAASGTADEVRELKQRRRRAGSTAASSTAAKNAGPETAAKGAVTETVGAMGGYAKCGF